MFESTSLHMSVITELVLRKNIKCHFKIVCVILHFNSQNFSTNRN